MAHFFVARDDRRHRDHVIGIRGMTHPKEEAERDDGEQANHFVLTKIRRAESGRTALYGLD